MKRLVMFTLALMILTVSLLGAATPAKAYDCDGHDGWYGIHFTKELPAGYWPVGDHNYEYYVYDSSTSTWSYFTKTFKSDPGAPTYYGQAFMRVSGVRTNVGTVGSIHPSEDTLFQVTYLLSNDYATATTMRSYYTVWLRSDGGSWVSLPASKVMKWCEISPTAPHHWTRIWDYDY